MKNIFLFFLLITLSLGGCKSAKKAVKASNCCPDVENFDSKNALGMPESYNRKCATMQCLQLVENQNLDCVDFKLLTRFGTEIVVFSSDIPIRVEDLARELNSQMSNLEHEGIYIYIAQYKMDGKCFKTTEHINIL